MAKKIRFMELLEKLSDKNENRFPGNLRLLMSLLVSNFQLISMNGLEEIDFVILRNYLV